jgi:RNA polymerase sigma-70 factor (ECF subfamily)
MTSLPPASPPGRPDPASLFEGWVRSHHAAVYRSAWRITRNGADAEDVAQRVFLDVLRRLTRHELPEWTNGAEVGDRLRWLAVKTALDFRRGEANRRRREEARAMETSERSAEVAPDPARTELLQQLRRCVTRLPEELRIATVLRFEEGLPFAAMAEVVGVSEPTMFERVKRALEKLRVGLAQAGHAGALFELEALLAVEEGVAVPARLCATLLALPAGAAIGASTAAASVSTATTSPAAWLAAAAAVVVLVGGGAAVVHAVRSDEAGARAPRNAAAPNAAPSATPPATAEPTRVADAAPATPAEALGARPDGRVRAGLLLSCDLGIPPDESLGERLVETAHLHGFAFDDDDRPLPKVQVVATSSTDAPKAFAWRAQTESGADGSFDLRVAAVTTEPQPYVLVFDHADVLRRKLDATVTPGATTELHRIELLRNAADRAGEFELSLTLVGPDGEAVPGAIVRMFRKLVARSTGAPNEERVPRYEWQVGGMADERGALRLSTSRIGEKRLEIHARRAGYRDLVVDRHVEAIGASEQVVVLEKGLTLTGRLVAPEGDLERAALRGAQVDAIRCDAAEVGATRSGGAFADEPFEADVAADGTFVVRGLDPGRYRLRLHGDFSPAWVDDVVAGRSDLSLPLKRADDPSEGGLHRAEIHGRIVDEQGAPLAVELGEVEVVALPADWPPDDPRIFTEFVPARLAPRMQQESQVLFDESRPRPGPSSAFHMNDLDSGNYLILVRAPGRAPGVSKVVTVGRDRIVRDVVVALARSQ